VKVATLHRSDFIQQNAANTKTNNLYFLFLVEMYEQGAFDVLLKIFIFSLNILNHGNLKVKICPFLPKAYTWPSLPILARCLSGPLTWH
jgi:hypothetical protein